MSEDSSSVSIIDRQTAMQLGISPVYPKGWLIDRSQPLFTLEQVDLSGINETGMGGTSTTIRSRSRVNKSTCTST